MEATYATGRVTAGGGNVGGLAGRAVFSPPTVNSYWDTEKSGIAAGASSHGVGKTTSELQTPTAYGDIYGQWNVDVTDTGNIDDPWDFGLNSQYPALKYDGMDVLRQGRNTILFSTDALDVTEEDSAGANYTVRLGGAPKAGTTVTVTITSPADDDAVSYTHLTLPTILLV